MFENYEITFYFPKKCVCRCCSIYEHFSIDAIRESSDKCYYGGFDRDCALMLGYSVGAVSTRLFFISGATWKFEK